MQRNIIEAINNHLIKIGKDIESGKITISDLRNNKLRAAYARGKELLFIEYISLSDDILLKPIPAISTECVDSYESDFSVYIQKKLGLDDETYFWDFLFSPFWGFVDQSLNFDLKKFKLIYDHGEEIVDKIYSESIPDHDYDTHKYIYRVYDQIGKMDVDISCYGGLQQ